MNRIDNAFDEDTGLFARCLVFIEWYFPRGIELDAVKTRIAQHLELVEHAAATAEHAPHDGFLERAFLGRRSSGLIIGAAGERGHERTGRKRGCT